MQLINTDASLCRSLCMCSGKEHKNIVHHACVNIQVDIHVLECKDVQ
jgi:hypothetical protein